MTMAKKAKKTATPAPPKPKLSLAKGAGCDLTPTEYGTFGSSYVAVRFSVVSGIDLCGPFLDADSAEAWIRKESERENYERFDTANPPGVTWCVEHCYLPTQYGYE